MDFQITMAMTQAEQIHSLIIRCDHLQTAIGRIQQANGLDHLSRASIIETKTSLPRDSTRCKNIC